MPYKVKFVILQRYTLRATAIKQENLNCLKYFEIHVTFIGKLHQQEHAVTFSEQCTANPKRSTLLRKFINFNQTSRLGTTVNTNYTRSVSAL